MSEKIEYLGLDTSNYTTSVALLSGGEMHSARRLLPVKDGERGLRQSDAVFLHIRQLPDLFASLPSPMHPRAIGVSVRPRWEDGSYMPCFTVGQTCASVLASQCGCPIYPFSHQQGHIAAGLWSAGREDLLNEKFLAFHVSGGTTELLYVDAMKVRIVSKTLDLHAGQLIDRVGVMLGYPFPCGAAMDPDALRAAHPISHKVTLKNGNCALSGWENKAKEWVAAGVEREEIAFRTVSAVIATLEKMIDEAMAEYSDLPLLTVGGVCSSSLLRRRFSEKYGAIFAADGYSCDNAAGIAWLMSCRAEGRLL